MFTGIIEAVGTIASVIRRGQDVELTVNVGKLDMSDVKLGDSIAVNGTCLTVTHYTSTQFSADVSLETLERTGFSGARAGYKVNLEKALLPTTRLGGHLVSGHVDGRGTITAITDRGRAVDIWIQAPQALSRYIAEKGSVCIDGISLTVNQVKGEQFLLTIIPHTMQETTLAQCKVGEHINLEVDQIARYLERLLQAKQEETDASSSGVDIAMLAKAGFIR